MIEETITYACRSYGSSCGSHKHVVSVIAVDKPPIRYTVLPCDEVLGHGGLQGSHGLVFEVEDAQNVFAQVLAEGDGLRGGQREVGCG